MVVRTMSKRPAPAGRRATSKKTSPISLEVQQRLLGEVLVLRAKQSEIEEQLKERQAALLTAMVEQGTKTIRVTGEEVNGSATLTQGTTTVLHEEQIRKRLGAAIWAKVTTRRLDERRLEAAVASGMVDPVVVAACSEEVPKKPYLRVTRK